MKAIKLNEQDLATAMEAILIARHEEFVESKGAEFYNEGWAMDGEEQITSKTSIGKVTSTLTVAEDGTVTVKHDGGDDVFDEDDQDDEDGVDETIPELKSVGE